MTAQKSPAEAAADALIGALKDSDAGVRRQAAHSLGQMRSARAVPALIDALKDENAEVRGAGDVGAGRSRAIAAPPPRSPAR